jgi:hypothetical protein
VNVERSSVCLVGIVELEPCRIGAFVLIHGLLYVRLQAASCCLDCSSWAAGTNCGGPLAATIAERSAGSTITFKSAHRRSTPARRPIVFLECQAGIDEAENSAGTNHAMHEIFAPSNPFMDAT